MADLIGETDGSLITTTKADDLSGIYTDIQESIHKQYRLTFPSQAATSGPAELKLTIGTSTEEISYTPGARLSAGQLQPVEEAKPFGPSIFRTSGGLLIGLLLVLAAVAGAVWSVVSSFASAPRSLDTMLQPYADGFVAGEGADTDEDPSIVHNPMLQRAVQLTSEFADRRGALERIENSLERANLPLRAGEALFVYLAGIVAAFLLASVLARNVVVGLIFAVFFALVPAAYLNFRANRRRKQFHAQLPDTLQLLAGTLRAGYSLMQGVEAVAQEVAEPMRREITRVVTEARLGRPLEQSLDAVAERMDSNDFAWAVMAIRIQREVGGNLAELLLTVSETMVARERLRRDVNSLTAEGKISAIVLGILPLGLAGAMYVINPDYISLLWEETIGIAMLIGGVVLAGIGYVWMMRTIRIDI